MELDISLLLIVWKFLSFRTLGTFFKFPPRKICYFHLDHFDEHQPFLIQICSLDFYLRWSGAIKISSISKIYEFDVSHPLLVYIYITSKLILSMMRTISTQSCYFKKYMASQKNIWTLFYIRKFYLAPACTFGWVNIP